MSDVLTPRKMYAPRARIKDKAWMKERAVKYSTRAIKTIYEMIIDPEISASVRMDGAKYIVDRAFGKPETTGDSEQTKQIIVNILKFSESDVRSHQRTDDDGLLDMTCTDDAITDATCTDDTVDDTCTDDTYTDDAITDATYTDDTCTDDK